MCYSIESDIETDFKEDFEEDLQGFFPDSLTYFFEQYGGYEENSMVSQVEKILDIDLSLFQNTWHPEMEYDEDIDAESHEFWIAISEIKNCVTLFLQKIAANPTYYNQVNYIGEYFPDDHGYLSSNQLNRDLDWMLATLNQLEKEEAKKIRFVYM